MYSLGDFYFADQLLGRDIDERVLNKSLDWLYYFARTLGVVKEDIQPNFIVSQLITLYCYREVCQAKAFSISGHAFRDGDAHDVYASKLKQYAQEIERLEDTITPDALTGNSGKYEGFRAVTLHRG